MERPRALVLRAAGTNCDAELCRAFSLAGAEADLVHLDRVVGEPGLLDRYSLVGFPGGFSFGDDIASGRVFAMKVREALYPALRAALDRGALMIGVCNGFQVLVQVGLLPGPRAGQPWPESPPAQRVALTDNQDARFHARWVGVDYEPRSVCVWTRGLRAEDDAPRPANALGPTPPKKPRAADANMLPVAHGEGRLWPSAPGEIAELEAAGQVAVRYTENFNGSAGAIAGICDPSGRVLGLMPHPERFLEWTRHPYWTRLDPEARKMPTPGLEMFRNAVREAAELGNRAGAGR